MNKLLIIIDIVLIIAFVCLYQCNRTTNSKETTIYKTDTLYIKKDSVINHYLRPLTRTKKDTVIAYRDSIINKELSIYIKDTLYRDSTLHQSVNYVLNSPVITKYYEKSNNWYLGGQISVKSVGVDMEYMRGKMSYRAGLFYENKPYLMVGIGYKIK